MKTNGICMIKQYFSRKNNNFILITFVFWHQNHLYLSQQHQLCFACVEWKIETSTMSSKGAKYTTKCIEVPVFVLNIALLYAFLITVSHLLAWVTIARHEGTIEELKEILLRRIENEEKQPLTSDQTLRGDDGENTVVQESDVLKVCFLCFRFHFVVTAMTSPTLLTVVQPM